MSIRDQIKARALALTLTVLLLDDYRKGFIAGFVSGAVVMFLMGLGFGGVA